ncbi:murein transglycosylase A [Coxiella burnetii]|uniref:murein transglycosylase A n=1 Tax=Coxiella burnetii TaxID=777 RepID=UPI000BFB55A3|nr:MltA domain-containing protein [Coxiella burnetii]PHH56550.1 murein transglycosylase [Coxiella burnetii]
MVFIMLRSILIITGCLAITVLIGIFLLYYTGTFGPHFSLVKTSFNSLPEWKQDNQSQALIAFQKSCAEILKRNPHESFNGLSQAGLVQNWQVICNAANKVERQNPQMARNFFEHWFTPYSIKNNFNPRGLFTGYYLPLLHGSLKKEKPYIFPVYGLPKDLIKIDLGLFRPELAGRSIVAQLKKRNALLPYPDRAAINQGAIQSSAPVLVWCDSVIDLFFAEIQGSAIVKLPNKKQLLINYAGDNGHPYTPIGKILVERHIMTKEEASLQGVRKWLLDHATEVNALLNCNASFVFFKLINNSGPLGTEKIVLTPERSLAVDKRYIPLGAPIWINTTSPTNHSQEKATPYRHLLIAQDTGGGIKGVVRGDIYWGAGDKAEFIAGHMHNVGKYWVLLPKMPQSEQLN